MSNARELSELAGSYGTGLSAGGLPDATITQAEIGTNVAGNGPAFSAYRTGSVQIPSAGVWTKVQLNAEEFDTANAFDKDANYRFQPSVAGYYFVSGTMASHSGSFTATMTSIYKNGSTIRKVLAYAGTANALDDWASTVCGLIYLNGTTDYLELYGFCIGNPNPRFEDGVEFTNFSGFLARAA